MSADFLPDLSLESRNIRVSLKDKMVFDSHNIIFISLTKFHQKHC